MYTNTFVYVLRWPHLRGAVRYLTRSNSSNVKQVASANKLTDTEIKSDENPKDAQLEEENTKRIRSSLIAAAFAPIKPRPNSRIISVNESIESATNPEELLALVDRYKMSRKQALRIISILAEWSNSGETEMKMFERDPRFTLLCQSLGKPYGLGTSKKANPSTPTSDDLAMVLSIKNDDEAAQIVTTFTLKQSIKVLSSLSLKKRRPVSLLRALSFSIVQNSAKFDLKEGADILYALASLNYPDEVLLEKVCGDLYEKIYSCKRTSIIGSISTSLGLLRYKDVDILDCLCEWATRNMEICRNQDLTSILLTLAHVNHKPVENEDFFREIRKRLLESDVSITRADVIWALTVLEEATPDDYASVLDNKYYDRVKASFPQGIPPSIQIKLLNIKGAAQSSSTYKGPLLPVTSDFDMTHSRSKEKQILVTSVLEAMSNLLPSSVYLKTNVNLNMGFNLDGECLVDSNLTPLPLVDRQTGKPVENKRGIKVAIMVWDYHEHTKGHVGLCGIPVLSQRLARASGYRILDVAYFNFNPKEKLTTRVKYLEKQLKTLVNPS